MFVLYNILQLLLLVVFFPVIVLFVFFKSKYRNRVPARLGFRLTGKIPKKNGSATTFWLHALSVGEVTSAFPLLSGLRQEDPDCRIIVSVTTRSGKKLADELLSGTADAVIDAPFDLLPTILTFNNKIKPDIYIQVETDFWPNILNYFKKKGTPTLLVNGRVSEKSMKQYTQMGFFFRPMFQIFTFLCLQTERDRINMQALGVSKEKLMTPGNLKFDTPEIKSDNITESCAHLIPKDKTILIAGSTHPGEEIILLRAYLNLKVHWPELFLILVPRDTGRAAEITTIANKLDMSVLLRSKNRALDTDVLIVDTIGELTLFYSFSDIAFVGGSLVNAGGHNPIEPATLALPVLFGPNMQDFTEIAADLINAGGAKEVGSQSELEEVITALLESKEDRLGQGQAAFMNVQNQRGVVKLHLDLIRKLL